MLRAFQQGWRLLLSRRSQRRGTQGRCPVSGRSLYGANDPNGVDVSLSLALEVGHDQRQLNWKY